MPLARVSMAQYQHPKHFVHWTSRKARANPWVGDGNIVDFACGFVRAELAA